MMQVQVYVDYAGASKPWTRFIEHSKISESAFAKHSARVSRAWGHSRHDVSTSAVSDMMIYDVCGMAFAA